MAYVRKVGANVEMLGKLWDSFGWKKKKVVFSMHF